MTRTISTSLRRRATHPPTPPSTDKPPHPAPPPPPKSPPEPESDPLRSTPREDAIAARSRIGPFSLPSALLFILAGVGLVLYFQHEKDQIEKRKREALKPSGIGRPRIGGPFQLTTHKGQQVTEVNFLGRFTLIYFGFTNCPDVCPEELDKMTEVVNHVEATYGPDWLIPIFVTCDPARDDQKTIAAYLKDFHPSMVGLTGSWEAIKSICKAYRVYFSTPPDTKPGDDYIVDHSIFFYLMAPNGNYVDAFGRAATQEDVIAKFDGYMEEWKKGKRWTDDDWQT